MESQQMESQTCSGLLWMPSAGGDHLCSRQHDFPHHHCYTQRSVERWSHLATYLQVGVGLWVILVVAGAKNIEEETRSFDDNGVDDWFRAYLC